LGCQQGFKGWQHIGRLARFGMILLHFSIGKAGY
jgi:hypothetical protein